jgi:parallel beta-helix repeat protein
MLGTLDRILSVGSWISTAKDLHDKYQTLCAIHHGETAFQKLDQKIERIAERILYAPDLQVVIDTNQTTQQVYRDHKQIHDALEPVQRALNQDILSSAMILTPEKMQQALITNPFEVLCDPRPLNFFDRSRMPPEGVPVLFEIDGAKYLGWQLRGTLPFLFNCRYDDLWIPSIISNPISQPISTPQSTTDLIVSPNGKYPTINSALKAAKDGDKIIVKTGLYKESIVLDKTVELIADGSPIIESTDDCIEMQTDYAVVKGFTLQCRAKEEDGKVGVFIWQGKLVLEHCDITCSSFACIQINNKDVQAVVRHCKIHDGNKGGIFIYDQATAQIEDCEIFGNGLSGIEVKTGGNAIIRRCKIYNEKQNGIFVWENGMGQIEDCEIFGNAYSGIKIKTGGNPTIRRCTIKNNSLGGIGLLNNGKATVEDCDLRGNKNGAWYIDKTAQVQKRNNQE